MRAPQYKPIKHVSSLGTFYIEWRSDVESRGEAENLHIHAEIEFYELPDGSFGNPSSMPPDLRDKVFKEAGIYPNWRSIPLPEPVYNHEFVRVKIRNLMRDLQYYEDGYPEQYAQALKEVTR